MALELKFETTLEMLLAKNASDLEVSKHIKKEIKAYFASLDASYDQNHGKHFLLGHTRRIEAFIVALYRYVLKDSFKHYLPPINTIPIALVALGSFGREQLCIYSDLDIMIVYHDIPGYDLKPLMERVLYLAWDAGLKLGHRVHEVSDLMPASLTDITIKTAILESRFIYGSRTVWEDVLVALNEIRLMEQRSFVLQKLEENKKRLLKFPLGNEPSIKDGYGALREDNTLLWVCKAFYGVTFIKDLVGEIVDEGAYREFRSALEFLFRLRVAMHLVAKKKKDQLTFDIQPAVAEKLGFKGTSTRSAERVLLKRTFDAMMQIHTFTHTYTETICQKEHPEWYAKMERLEEGLYYKEGFFYGAHQTKGVSITRILKVIVHYPNASYDSSMIGFLAAAHYPKKLTKELSALLMRLFHFPNLYALLEVLYEASSLHRLFTPIKAVLGLAQFDRYHAMPVGLHTIYTIKALENIKDPYVQGVYEGLDAKERQLLKAVALFHDLGKGRIRDHSLVGADIFKRYAERIGFGIKEIESGALLIRHHTLLSYVALREDIYNEKTVFEFITRIGTREHLDMLYVLTYADVNGVSAKAYSSYNADLMRTLYRRCLQVIDKREQIDEAAIRQRKERALGQLERFKNISKVIQKKTLAIESNLFFIKYRPYEIVDMVERIADVDPISIRFRNEKRLMIDVMCKQPFNLGWFLSRFTHIDLAQMDIFRLFDGVRLFRMEFNQSVEEDFSRLKKPFLKREHIAIDFDHSLSYAAMRLHVENQKGLMAFIIETFDALKIDIATAKVSTHRGYARDIFLIEKETFNRCGMECILEKLCQKEASGK